MFRVRTVMTGVVGTPWVSNMFFDGAGDSSPSVLRASVVAFWNQMNDVMHPDIDILVEGEVLEMSPVSGEAIGSTVLPASPASGGGTGEPLPFATQAYINWSTGVFINGRRLGGRTFIPGLTESANSTGLGPGTAVTQAAQLAIAELIGTTDAEFGVWSRKNGVFVAATGGQLSSRWGVLRSRKD